jgi:hypothetical protein
MCMVRRVLIHAGTAYGFTANFYSLFKKPEPDSQSNTLATHHLLPFPPVPLFLHSLSYPPCQVYEERILGITKAVIDACKKEPQIKRIIELSTAQVYEDSKKASSESSKIKPWTTMAEYKLKSEELWAQSGLPVVVFRPAIIYGPGDVLGMMPRLTIGRVYKFMDEKMKMLWGGEMRINTVHVRDVASAIWHALIAANLPTDAHKRIYNLADKSETDQKKVSAMISKIFGIRTGFYNAVINKLAKMNMKGTTEEVNDKHLPPWSGLCHKYKIEASPISPYISPQLLYDHSLSIDGSAVEAALHFKYEHPLLTEELLREELDYWIAQGVFPPNVSDDEPGEKSEHGSSVPDDKDEDEE